MACNNPTRAWRRPDLEGPRPPKIDPETGELVGDYAARLSFRPSLGWDCISVPCGRCNGCYADRARAWAIRSWHEASQHSQNTFLTLTYDDAHLPDGLVKSDLQKFFKRLRHYGPFRYIACGELGSLSGRPHYHALIFGQDYLGKAEFIDDERYLSPFVGKCWDKGQHVLGTVTMSSCCYVAGYCFKKVGDKDTFSLHSRRPGIGHDWLDKYSDDIRRTGSVTIEGKEYPCPSRYLVWEPDSLYGVKQARKKIFDDMPLALKERKEHQLVAKRINQDDRAARRNFTI